MQNLEILENLKYLKKIAIKIRKNQFYNMEDAEL